MTQVALDKKVPAFSRPATGDKVIRLSHFKGKKLVLYFYPKDHTPGCTTESQDFAASYSKFRRANTEILGISRDPIKSHEKFKDKHGLPFDLLSDEDETLCQLFDVIKMKNMYGKKVRGIVRSTFLVDEKGVLRREWRQVKVKGHVEEVLEASKSL